MTKILSGYTKTNGLPEDGAEIAENVISDADVIVKETNE